MVTGPEDNIVCQYDHICSLIKVGIDGAAHGVQAILENKSTTEEWGYLTIN